MQLGNKGRNVGQLSRRLERTNEGQKEENETKTKGTKKEKVNNKWNQKNQISKGKVNKYKV